jgi:large subunit ribosomal protein L29
MATKKFIELQEFTDENLKAELDETIVQYGKLKFDHAVKGLDNPLTLREVRRDIARLKTEVRRRELANASDKEISKRDQIRRRRRK